MLSTWREPTEGYKVIIPFRPLRPAHRAQGTRVHMGVLARDAARPQPECPECLVKEPRTIAYLWLNSADSSQGLAYLGLSRNKSPLLPIP